MSRRLLFVLSIVVAYALPASAQDWRFDPVVEFSVSHSDNVFLIDNPKQSDQSGSLDVQLNLTRAQPTGAVTLSLEPRYEKYDKFDSLDNTSYRANIDYAKRLSQRTEWSAGAGYTRSERSQVTYEAISQGLDLVALPRVRLSTLSAFWSGTFAVSEKSSMLGGVHYSNTDYGSTAVISDPSRAVGLQGSWDATADIGWRHRSSVRTSYGLTGAFSRIDEGARGQRDVKRLYGVIETGNPERLTLEIAAGGAWTSSRSGDVTVQTPGGSVTGKVPEPSNPDWVGSAQLSGRVGRRGDLTGSISRDVTSTFGTGGAAQTDGAFVAYRTTIGRFSQFSLSGRYTNRKPSESSDAFPATKTKAFGAEYRAAFTAQWALTIGAQKVKQDAADNSALAADYGIVSLGVRWSPLARGPASR